MPGRNKAAPHLSRNVLGVQLWVWLMAQRASGGDRSLSFTGPHRRAQHLLGDARTRHTPARTQERGKEGRRDSASLPVQRVWPAAVLGWAGRERGSGLVVGRSGAGPPCAHESRPQGHVESFGVGSDRQSRVIGYRVCRRRLERCPLSRATVGASQDGRRPRGEPGSRDVCPCRGQKGPKAADSW